MMNYVIIGNGMTGVTAARNIRRLDADARITIITDESFPFYSRPGLMYHMMGILKEWDLRLAKNDDFYHQIGAEIKYASAVRIANDWDAVELEFGETIAFDRLLLATGSVSRSLGVPGCDLPGSHFMYSLTDAKRIMDETHKGMKAVVVGGGLLGAELAEVWRHAGLSVTFLVLEPWYFPKALSEQQGRIIESEIRRHGCDLHLQEEVGEIRGGERISHVITKSGKEFSADILGITIGVTPNMGLAKASGLETGRGILVDPYFRTSRGNVFAGGDCAEIKFPASERTTLEQLWYSADRQGQVVARNMCGDLKPYDPGPFYNSARFFDLDYVSVGAGRYQGDNQEDETVVSGNGRAARRFVHRNGIVTGITTVGTNDNPTVIMSLVGDAVSLTEAKRRLGVR
jgi:NADPH-dependent 2,4-dienoyl-CoA reductase/sulfur reductase-like enzyme